MKFGVYLKNLREEQGLSQEALAKAIGVSRQSISKWEVGLNVPKVDKLLALSSVLQVDISELIAKYQEK